MEQTKEMKQIIAQIIQDIQEQQSYRAVEAGDDVRVIEDLGFSSLDIAQLVAQMEMETGVDPFSQGETISSITTVGSICDNYQKYMDSAQS
ncbi:acyl carrier protein [Bacillus velezensis]|uniref:acyl carrier protein n=1 Tax=Bacillus velezensis TaxID=492670 RepID=UPI002DB5FD98|nr:acyl carrier protein [Bacillus velezensis]MEC2352648.1 acyl carrier protein [Bacillus velezensis]